MAWIFITVISLNNFQGPSNIHKYIFFRIKFSSRIGFFKDFLRVNRQSSMEFLEKNQGYKHHHKWFETLTNNRRMFKDFISWFQANSSRICQSLPSRIFRQIIISEFSKYIQNIKYFSKGPLISNPIFFSRAIILSPINNPKYFQILVFKDTQIYISGFTPNYPWTKHSDLFQIFLKDLEKIKSVFFI